MGSVGRPMTLEKEACYVVISFDKENQEYTLEHILVSYDNKLAAQKIRERGLRECDKLAQMVEG